MGDTEAKMYVRKKKYPSGNIGIIVVEKIDGKMKELATIGIARHDEDTDVLIVQAKEWIEREKQRPPPSGSVRRRTGQMRGGTVDCGTDAVQHLEYHH